MMNIELNERVIELLRTVYDPEIPVNIYDLGLIYNIDINEEGNQLQVDMTLTAPNCPAADFIVEDVRQKLETIEDFRRVDVNLVFEPEWNKDMMSEEAKLELGFEDASRCQLLRLRPPAHRTRPHALAPEPHPRPR